MVLIAPLIGAAVFLSGFAAALPTQNYNNNPYNGNSNNNYGGNNNNNYGGNNNNNYGGNSNNNNNNNNYGGNNYNPPMQETTTMMNDKTTTTMMDDKPTSTPMMDDKQTMTTTTQNSYQTPSYGSGKSYWGGNGYNDCVNQCIAQFGGSSGGGSYENASPTAGSAGSTGTGATHTVIVAPSKGVFRMVPFATNASVGDTIKFVWGADGHTVTKSSALTPCNKSSSDPVFASGIQNKSFVFTQVVNDTNPTFYYCGVPTHCEKGMFGVINPAMATPGAPNSMALAMASMATNDSDLSAFMAYANNATANSLAASTWAQGIDMNQFPDWAKPLAAENVMLTRIAMAMNADIVKPDNSIDLSSVASTPLMLPVDIKQALDNAAAPADSSSASNSASNSPSSAPSAPASSSSSAPSSASSDKPKNAAVSLSSPRLLVGAVVVLATFFAL